MLPGTEWGATVLVSGILQGLGAELAFAVLGYSAFGAAAAALAGVLSAPLEWAFEVVRFPASWADVPVLSVLAGGGGWYAEWDLPDKLVYLGAMAVSGAVLAGLVGWLLVRALARAGALSPSRPGRSTGSGTLSDPGPDAVGAPAAADGGAARGPVEVDALTWRPFGRREPVLRDVSLDPAARRRVLLVGPRARASRPCFAPSRGSWRRSTPAS